MRDVSRHALLGVRFSRALPLRSTTTTPVPEHGRRACAGPPSRGAAAASRPGSGPGWARPMIFARRACLYPEYRLTEAEAMRNLTFGMNMSLDGYIAAPGDDLGWSVPSDELFQWWSDRGGATGLALYGRTLW